MTTGTQIEQKRKKKIFQNTNKQTKNDLLTKTLEALIGLSKNEITTFFNAAQ